MLRAPAALALVAAAALASCGREASAPDAPIEPGHEISAEIAAGAAPQEPLAPPAWLGEWAPDPALCGIAPGSADPSPVSFTAGEFMGYEERCRIGAAEEGTEGGWLLALVCEDATGELVRLLEVDVDGATMRLKRDGGPEATLLRCVEKED